MLGALLALEVAPLRRPGAVAWPRQRGQGHVARLAMNFIYLAAFNQPCCGQKGRSSGNCFSFSAPRMKGSAKWHQRHGSQHRPHGADGDHVTSRERHGEPFPDIEPGRNKLFSVVNFCKNFSIDRI